MPKVTPNPPDAAHTASANESPKTEPLDEATPRDDDEYRASFAHIRATPRTPSTMFIANPDVDVQDLLGFSSEALASACVMIMDQADRETGPSRNTLLGVHLIISSIEISVNRALDHLDPIG
ncbi:hypothetical protein PS662_04135 [Pseudomonas fluorescens]|uniref:DUF3077 domain-containing protein n=1 Tax=Pseudomonas fluorescens TaxID=294 RepID=A0A5E6VNV2_PSEFL|nr:hypothetical protein [Pseudomonas fluorescens]VVN16694.1 hypothetical protein PS662_04135 [Pseudomonas fluorescens]